MSIRMDDSTITESTSVLLTHAKTEQMSRENQYTGEMKPEKFKITVQIIFENNRKNNRENNFDLYFHNYYFKNFRFTYKHVSYILYVSFKLSPYSIGLFSIQTSSNS